MALIVNISSKTMLDAAVAMYVKKVEETHVLRVQLELAWLADFL